MSVKLVNCCISSRTLLSSLLCRPCRPLSSTLVFCQCFHVRSMPSMPLTIPIIIGRAEIELPVSSLIPLVFIQNNQMSPFSDHRLLFKWWVASVYKVHFTFRCLSLSVRSSCTVVNWISSACHCTTSSIPSAVSLKFETLKTLYLHRLLTLSRLHCLLISALQSKYLCKCQKCP